MDTLTLADARALLALSRRLSGGGRLRVLVRAGGQPARKLRLWGLHALFDIVETDDKETTT